MPEPIQSLIATAQLEDMMALAYTTPPGMIVEVGVYRGGSAYYLGEVALRQARALHLFDTFTGIPFKGPNDKHVVGDFSDISITRLMRLLPHAEFHIGVFPGTLKDDIKDIAFAHVDCDQEQSVEDCIAHLWPRVVHGGVMLFDDYPYLPGAKLAVERHFSSDTLRWTSRGHRAYVVKGG